MKSNGRFAVAAAFAVTVNDPADATADSGMPVVSLVLGFVNILLVARHAELVTTHVLAAAAIAARPDGVLIVVLPGEPELSV
jgi:hypothetical protein